ncbi:hypothetical protein CONCODRAFT_135410 [Conidiobolus coronatus NRRL 28638]|uniref:Uncharacterized protein n=1 Tax=Conidiobolus coronatus (strain ATCC 28846 / CBS 209.66 / NRRL 28638) TaxID=796925 RepID=A0A137PBF3_CONC2|nr:hypothetical protein CONCODRAFT_135410 [Conidiobolus coronatus NRRL 28638]|eukprot:KXN72335.1 hypothetical protein CONCODRAFT_135410 [Conidiobolus coronatus NRRL 28638]
MTKSTSSAARAKPLTTARLKSGKNNAEGEDSPLSSLSSMSSPSASPVKAKKSDKNSKDSVEEDKDQDKAEEDIQNELQEADSLLDGLLNFGPGEASTEAKNISEAAKSPFEPKQDEQLTQKDNLSQVSHSVPLTSIHTEQDNLIAKSIDFETIDVLQNSPIAQQLDTVPYEPISVAQPAVFDNTIDPQQFLQAHTIDPVYEGHQEEHIMVDDNAHQEFNPEQIILDIVESQERFTRSRSGRVIKQTNSNMAYNDEDDMDNDFVPSDNDQDDHSAHSGDNKRQRKNEPIQYHPIEGYLNMKVYSYY